jgi:hypothetical protein
LTLRFFAVIFEILVPVLMECDKLIVLLRKAALEVLFLFFVDLFKKTGE